DPTFEPDCLTWLPSTRKYHGEYACHSNIPPVSLRWKPRSSACHPAGLGCGKLAVRFAVPAPVNGVRPLLKSWYCSNLDGSLLLVSVTMPPAVTPPVARKGPSSDCANAGAATNSTEMRADSRFFFMSRSPRST